MIDSNILIIIIFGVILMIIGISILVLLNKLLGVVNKKNDVLNDSVMYSQNVINDNIDFEIPNRQEFIAAVSAAIAEDMGTDISGLRILSVKKI